MERRPPDSEDLHLPASPPPSSSLEPYRPEPESPWPEVIDNNLREAIQTYREVQERKAEAEKELAGIDKTILMVFAIALLGSLFFTFYMLALDRLDPVTNVLYPIITAILGFMSGYFAGTGRVRGRG